MTLFAWLVAAIALGSAQAETVSYTLDDVFLLDGTQMTGAFDWTYTIGDFEGGTAVFTALEIPWRPSGTAPPLEDPGMVLTIEYNQIEISLDGNFHDYGLDISLKFVEPLSTMQSSPVDLTTSFFECCGNGFRDQPFISGSIAPFDGDGDGVPDAADNCLAVSNADQRDTNSDGFGNRCDPDLNNDCTVDFLDVAIMKQVFLASDLDSDFDGDGFVGFLDLGILKGFFLGSPGPSANGCTPSAPGP